MTTPPRPPRFARPGRDVRFDLLKSIALVCIVLAHTTPAPPKALFAFRMFDVPLLVLISGALFGLREKTPVWWKYALKRLWRFLAPTWIFFSAFFLVSYVLFRVLGWGHPFSRQVVLETFLLGKGVGFLWIVRVFLSLAVLAPVIRELKTRSGKWFPVLLLLAYGVYEVFCRAYEGTGLISYEQVHRPVSLLLYAVPYGCVFGLGMVLPRLGRRAAVWMGLAFLVLFGGLSLGYGTDLFTHAWQYAPLQAFKYPPRLYYLSYGIGVSFLLYGAVHPLRRLHPAVGGPVRFISACSFDIYLWHIALFHAWGWFVKPRAGAFEHFAAHWAFLFFGSLAATFLIRSVADRLGRMTVRRSRADAV